MNIQINKVQEDCEICFKIKCKKCGWEPDGTQLEKIMAGKLTVCPDCGFAK
jgi:DNA-directed RNA polymerase subunit RPC12/RpoP